MFDVVKEVEAFDCITIFRHQSADADALGSQFGMKLFLQQNFPDKVVYALGDDVGSCASMFPTIDQVQDEDIARSCAIILDSANQERIDDQRFQTAAKIIKIDHHIVVDDYADIAYVDTTAAATCEILARLFEQSKLPVSTACANYLYLGLLADSLSFTTASTTKQTLLSAAFLVGCGIDVNQIQQQRSGISLAEFRYVSDIRNRVQIAGQVAYAIMNVEDYERFGFDYTIAKEKVYALSNVKEFEIYCLFTEDQSYGEVGFYNGSLRSKNVAINEVANRFGGGGHANACGVKKLSLQQINTLVASLQTLLK